METLDSPGPPQNLQWRRIPQTWYLLHLSEAVQKSAPPLRRRLPPLIVMMVRENRTLSGGVKPRGEEGRSLTDWFLMRAPFPESSRPAVGQDINIVSVFKKSYLSQDFHSPGHGEQAASFMQQRVPCTLTCSHGKEAHRNCCYRHKAYFLLMVLSLRQLCPPGDIWQCLQTFLAMMTEAGSLLPAWLDKDEEH